MNTWVYNRNRIDNLAYFDTFLSCSIDLQLYNTRTKNVLSGGLF
jgi:hypothetical protein